MCVTKDTYGSAISMQKRKLQYMDCDKGKFRFRSGLVAGSAIKYGHDLARSAILYYLIFYLCFVTSLIRTAFVE
jgi:hypothetical protein